MIIPWTVESLLRDLAARGAHPAAIWFGEGGVETWGSQRRQVGWWPTSPRTVPPLMPASRPAT